MNIFRPVLSDAPLLRDAHKLYYGKYPKSGYYEEIIYISHNPIYITADEEHNITGYIASRVKPQSSTVYIIALAVFNESVQTAIQLIKNVISDSEKLMAKRIEIHMRETRTEIINIFETLGFKSKLAGTYQNGDEKLLLYLDLPNGKEKLTLPTYASKKGKRGVYTKPLKSYKKPPPKPEPKKGYYEISRAKKTDLRAVTQMHNAHLSKERTQEYFAKLLKVKPSFFWVARDSNSDVVGYLAARPERVKGITQGPYTKLNFVSMGIGKGWRKLGIAQALIKKMFFAVKNNNSIEYIYGHVRGENEAARRLYRKLGFRERRVGIYQDDDDYKYEIFKRYRLPSLYRYWTSYKDYIVWFAMGVIAHEAFTLVTED